LDQDDFGHLAYKVMGCVFDIHKEFGRFFDEKIYKRELRRRYPGVVLDAPIELRFEDFHKLYLLDALVNESAPFEFNTVESLTANHRAQFIQCLLLAELPHGKLVNMRAEQAQHEFVNATLRLADRTRFVVTSNGWQEIGGKPIREWFTAFLRDIGTCLRINLYEEALTHLLGGEEHALQDVEVVSGGISLGQQKFHLAGPEVAFKVTAFPDPARFDAHARRLLEHTSLKVIQWINVAQREVSFRTVRK
jgi:GxxExxY protein